MASYRLGTRLRAAFNRIAGRGIRPQSAAASAGSAATSPPPPPRKTGRRIILFSDGTGNSSGKLFKTNVWRLYEALDLGPPDTTKATPDVEQIALYANGVGTSTFRPLAILGGIFGFGLKSNILQLYKFLCRNWHEGDELFLFGFSRGAFTIRVLVGLIANQGILRGDDPTLPPDEDKLAYQARAAYRAFARETWPNRWLAHQFSRVVRRIRDWCLERHRRFTGRDAYDNSGNRFTDIAFVGVWDTVGAYGGPIVEITRGIDDWIWPLSMPNYQLSPRVLKARHALAIDDERDSFQPLLWDEVREEMLVRWGAPVHVEGDPDAPGMPLPTEIRQVAADRLKQVWFSGMHADVGGGYSDESLSFLSLAWMIDEIGTALRLLPERRLLIGGLANAFGPLHDSRAGFGSYYRYQPRRISAMVDHYDERPAPDVPSVIETATLSLRDPEVADRAYVIPDKGVAPAPEVEALADRIRADHGLLTRVHIHESVIRRIAAGTDSYAPIGLPQEFQIAYGQPGSLLRPMLDRAEGARIVAERTTGQGWYDRHARAFDMVWWRRLQYFATVILSIVLVALPWWGDKVERVPVWCADDRCIVRPLLSAINSVTGNYAALWVGAVADHVLPSALLIAAIALLTAYSHAYGLRLRGFARRAWQKALSKDKRVRMPYATRGIARIRDGSGYQRVTAMLKWRIAPFIAALVMLALGLNLVCALVAQLVVFPLLERHDAFCPARVAGPPPIQPVRMDIRNQCNVVPGGIVANTPYTISIKPDATPLWNDSGHRYDKAGGPISPAIGHGADLPLWVDIVGVPWRRVVRTGWLQPLVRVRTPYPENRAEPGKPAYEFGRLWRAVWGRPVYVQAPALKYDPGSKSYKGQFTSRIDGEVSVLVNDAILPGLYDNNCGCAEVRIAPASEAEKAAAASGDRPQAASR